MPSGPSPPKAPGKVAPFDPPAQAHHPDNDDAISPTPSRGPLHRPPSPGGGGLALQCLLSKTPPPHLPGKAAPSTPAPEPPGQAVERTGESPKVTISSPDPRGGGGSPPAVLAEGACFTLSPLERPAPRTARKACPFDPPLRPPAKPSSELANP
ncbi:hypothetical protein N7530_012846 [Penicillium desertorum]|uniref:Uncharacterized protein n=1 Tax=Penicillium desertorum TaxID=1303715 RepID=A0A9X0BFG0_9EURO|nr:hypothetical protein N7530_012846 [Penicillium desertorum]